MLGMFRGRDRRPLCDMVEWAGGFAGKYLTVDVRVADEVELSTLNSVIGLHSVSGRWVTYDTPPDGKRFAFLPENSCARPGASELSCCAVNGLDQPQ